jgi:hypothetical protein
MRSTDLIPDASLEPFPDASKNPRPATPAGALNMSAAPMNSIHAKLLEDQAKAKAEHEQRMQTLSAISPMFGGAADDDFNEQDEKELREVFKRAAQRRSQRRMASVRTEGGPARQRWSSQSYHGR